jgi:hypothetical protein
VIPVPPSLQRLADEIDGWLDLRCPERALELLRPLLDEPAGRPAGLTMRIRALTRLGQHREAMPDLAELRSGGHVADWVDLTEAWCRKRLQDLPGAIRGLENLVARNPKSDIGHFNLGCYLALAGDRQRAIDEVTLACGLTDGFRDFARDEPDLDNLRNDPTFRQLLRQTGATSEPDDPAGEEDEDDDDSEDAPPAHGLN